MVEVPDDALEERFLAATGPGGQNVNKVATACQLRVDVFRLGLHPESYRRLKLAAGSRLTAAGVLVLTARRYRTQETNRADARARLAALLTQAEEREALLTRGSVAPPSGVESSGRAAAAIDYAMAQVGKSYVYGAAGPSAFDCSGLTMMAWAQAGVGLPHSSSAQYGSGARVAASDPALWQQILEANSEAVLDLLAEVRADLDALMAAVASDASPDLVEILTRGNAGTAAIPGKHGGPARPTRSVFVAVPDHPGELARLFGDAGEIGINIEDVHIDHDPGRPVGLTELVVERGSAEQLLAALESRGWTTHR